ncbi:MAG: alpha/beta hydrolase [Desulfobacteraceae bacterium]|nr:alpha/beta hydrolase [Desulfobacteraceae bacterium]
MNKVKLLIISLVGVFISYLLFPSVIFSKNLTFEKEFNVIKVDIAMDGNRDGTIDFDVPEDGKYLFWVNDDYDKGHIEQLATNLIFTREDDFEGNERDCDDDYIGNSTIWWENTCKRDLEDFTKLHLKMEGISKDFSDISYYLKFENVTSGNPSVNIFKAINLSFNYLSDPVIVAKQLEQTKLITVGSSEAEIDKEHIIAGTSSFLLEGRSPGKGDLTFIVKHNGNIVCKKSVKLELKPIKEFYQKFKVDAMGLNDEVNTNSSSVGSYTYSPKTNDYILFVHGWNVEEWLKDRWAETMFKRLWWLGYKGHCGLFSWPTQMLHDDIALDFYDAIVLDNYNHSEMRAWNSAEALLKQVKKLDSEHKGKVRIIAHSMGNVVTSEALRQSSIKLMHTYISSQAALSAHSYDNKITYDDKSSYWPNFETPDLYKFYPSGKSTDQSYFVSVKDKVDNLVRFYNVNDFALKGWKINNENKPKNVHDDRTFDLHYYYCGSFERYDPSAGDRFCYEPIPPVECDISVCEPLYDEMHYTIDCFPIPPNTLCNKDIGLCNEPSFPCEKTLRLPDDRYEIFAFCAESRSLALGAQNGHVDGFDNEIDLQDTELGLNYDNHHYSHSKQFRSNIIDERNYWQKVVDVAELPTTIQQQ